MDEKSNTQEHLIAFAKRKKTLIVLTFSFFLVFIVVVTVIMITTGGSNYQSSKIPEKCLNGIRYLRNSMKDPSSFVIYGDVIVFGDLNEDFVFEEGKEHGSIQIGIKYNANNSYGALGGKDEGVILDKKEGGWWYCSMNSDDFVESMLGGSNGKNGVESAYEYMKTTLELRENQLKEIKAGKSKLSKEEQDEAKEQYERLIEEKEKYYFYDG